MLPLMSGEHTLTFHCRCVRHLLQRAGCGVLDVLSSVLPTLQSVLASATALSPAWDL